MQSLYGPTGSIPTLCTVPQTSHDTSINLPKQDKRVACPKCTAKLSKGSFYHHLKHQHHFSDEEIANAKVRFMSRLKENSRMRKVVKTFQSSRVNTVFFRCHSCTRIPWICSERKKFAYHVKKNHRSESFSPLQSISYSEARTLVHRVAELLQQPLEIPAPPPINTRIYVTTTEDLFVARVLVHFSSNLNPSE